EAGVDVREYLRGQSLVPRNWMDKAVSTIRAAADEAAVADSSIRTHETHDRMFREGKVVGGRIFGYRNVDIFNGADRAGRPLRSHVVREINPDEAAVVVRIFELFDAGWGLKRIAKLLTQEGAPTPHYGPRIDFTPLKGWSPSTVRSVLTRQTYRGIVIWGKT